jgi:hypothetical protein
VSCCACFFLLLYACIFFCLSLYFVSFVLLFDVGVLGLHFLCVQGVFSVSCMLPGWCFVFWSCMWFQWHMLCVFSFFVDIFSITSAIYMIVYVCLGSCVTVRRCLLAFIVCCVFPVLFLLVCVWKGSVAIFSFVCTYISHFMTVM